MEKPQNIKRDIAFFKGYIVIFLLWISSPLWLFRLITFHLEPHAMTGLLVYIAFALYVILLFQLHVVSKKLHQEGFLKLSAISVLLIAIAITFLFPLGIFVLFGIIWVKANHCLNAQINKLK